MTFRFFSPPSFARRETNAGQTKDGSCALLESLAWLDDLTSTLFLEFCDDHRKHLWWITVCMWHAYAEPPLSIVMTWLLEKKKKIQQRSSCTKWIHSFVSIPYSFISIESKIWIGRLCLRSVSLGGSGSQQVEKWLHWTVIITTSSLAIHWKIDSWEDLF